MNIAFVNWYSFNNVIGGVESVGWRLANELKDRGHSVSLVAVRKVYDTPPGLETMLFPSHRQVDSEQNYHALCAFLLQNRVQIMVCHNAYRKKLGQLLERIAKEHGIKLVFVLHTTPDYFLHKQVSPSWLGCPVRRIRLLKRRRMWRQMYNACDAFVLLAEPYKPIFERVVQLPSADKLRAIPNANTYINAEYLEAEKENMVLFVGRLSKEKGIPKIIQIWREVSRLCPTWELVVVGDGPLRSELERANLERCRLVGVQNPQDYYRRAKLLLLTSDYEGWGMVLTEGMQYGVVPVVFDTYMAAPVILDYGSCGSLVRPGDIQGFGRELCALMNEVQRRIAMAEQATDYVRNFDRSSVCDRWEKLLEELVGGADQ